MQKGMSMLVYVASRSSPHEQLCRYIRSVIDTSKETQLRIELLLDGMMLNNDSYETGHYRSSSALVRQVKARRQALDSGPLGSYLRRILILPQHERFAFDVCLNSLALSLL
jgi:hypothetical protein